MEKNSELYELLDELVKGEDVSWNRTIYTDDKLVDYISQDKDNKKASTIIIEFPDEEDFLYTLGVDDDDDIYTYRRFNYDSYGSDIDYYRYEEDFREGYLLDNFDESNTLKLNNILRFLNPSLIGGDKDKIAQFLTQSFPSESDEIIYEYGYRDRDCIERAVKEEINSETKNPYVRFGIKEIYNGRRYETNVGIIYHWYKQLKCPTYDLKELLTLLISRYTKTNIGGWYELEYNTYCNDFDSEGFQRDVSNILDKISDEIEDSDKYVDIEEYKNLLNKIIELGGFKNVLTLPKDKTIKYVIKGIDPMTNKVRLVVQYDTSHPDYDGSLRSITKDRSVDFEGLNLFLYHPELFKESRIIIERFF
jgi:hypothetical protein